MRKQSIFLVFLTLVLGAGLASGVQARSATHSWEDSYISMLEGRAFGQYPDGADFEALQENMPLEEGVRLITDEGGLMEVCLYGGTTAWMDAETAFGIEALFEKVHLALHEGAVFIRHPLDGENRFSIDVTTPAARVQVSPGSLVRLSLDAGGGLLVEVWDGSAEVSSRHGAVSLGRGKRVRVTAGGERFQAADFSLNPRGPFERTCLQRDEKISTASARTADYVSRPVGGLADLEGHGVWVYESHYRSYVWRPHVDRRWRPYMYGRWMYHASGPYWVSADPWGWAPYHYGRWVRSRRGYWCWMPGYRFSPARVAFFMMGGCYVWAPSDYFGRPACGHRPGCGCGGFVYGPSDCFYGTKHGPHRGGHRYAALDHSKGGGKHSVKPVVATPLAIAKMSKAADRIRSGLQKASKRLRDRLSENRGRGLFARAKDRQPARSVRTALKERFQQRRPLQLVKKSGRPVVKKRLGRRSNFQVMPVRKILADVRGREKTVVKKLRGRMPVKPFDSRKTLLAKAEPRRPLKKGFKPRLKRPGTVNRPRGSLSGRRVTGLRPPSYKAPRAVIKTRKSPAFKPGAVRRSVQKRMTGRVSLGNRGRFLRR